MGGMAQRGQNARAGQKAAQADASKELLAWRSARQGQENGEAPVEVNGKDQGLDKPDSEVKSDLVGEYANIGILLLLYTLQGIPMGLSAVVPMLLKERKVSFAGLSTFSLNAYPFSFKLLWAPIVDVAYFPAIGRRKTWMVPAQLLIGIVMLVLSTLLDDLLYVDEPHIYTLTALFFLLYFLCATQDIAVDGWALTMLRKENVGYAATCNSIGQTLGYALGFTGFMALEHFGLATLPTFMAVWGCIFILVTLVVAVAKSENPVPPEDEPDDIKTAYSQMFSLLKLRAVRSLVLILFTWKASFAVSDGVAALKFQEYGISKEHMAYMTTILMPVYILLPVLIARWTSSGQPFSLALRAYPWRVLLVPLTAVLAYFTPATMTPTPWGFYALVLGLSFMGVVASQCMFVSQMAFFAKISDPAMGGTYMTMLNTLANLGGMWPPTMVMRLVDATTCMDERCPIRSDGFYVMGAVCFFLGLAWCALGLGPARRLQHLKASEWKVR